MRLLVLLLCGCLHGKTSMPTFAVPQHNVPFQYRYSYYTGLHGARITRDYLGFSLQRGSYSAPYLLLGDGRKVFNILEVAPNVAADTELGKAIVAQQRARQRNTRIDMISFGAIGIGVAAITLGALAVANDQKVLGAIPMTV